MAGHDASDAGHEGNVRTVDLARAGVAPELDHGFREVRDATGTPGMALREQSPVRVHRQSPVEPDACLLDEGAALIDLKKKPRDGTTGSGMRREQGEQPIGPGREGTGKIVPGKAW